MVYSSLARAKPLQDIEAFQLSVTGKSTVAAVIDNGAKRFEQVEHLLEAREPYARIVRGKSPEQTLAQAYFEEIGRVSWLSHGPGKAVRFALFTGAGLATGAVLSPLVGAAVGVGLGILDSFVLDNVIKGNACRSFVETKLTPFVSPA